MSNSNQSILLKIFNFIKSDFLIILADAIAVNVAYYFAILLRFFVSGGFQGSGGTYLHYYMGMSPWYTVLAIFIFAKFHLYGGMWRYAGMNDMNRIALANICTTMIMLVGSRIYMQVALPADRIADRMPVPFYFIGALMQFIFIVVIRFAYRIVRLEKQKISTHRSDIIPAIVIGSGDMARKIVQHLEDNTPYRAVVMAGKDSGKMMDGIPVVAISEAEQQIKNRNIQAVFIADKELTKEEREYIHQLADGLELEDYTGHISNQNGFLPLTNLLDVMDMPIQVVVDGKEQKFSSAEECLSSLPGEYDITRVQASKLFLKKREEDKSWMAEYRNQTGQDVSFF